MWNGKQIQGWDVLLILSDCIKTTIYVSIKIADFFTPENLWKYGFFICSEYQTKLIYTTKNMFTMNKNYLWWHKNIKLSYTQHFFNVQGMHFKACLRLTVDITTVVVIIATIIIMLIQKSDANK